MNVRRLRTLAAGLTIAWACFATAGPETEAHPPSQAAADVIREAAGAEAAFLAAGMVRDQAKSDDLATLLRYPTDELAVVRLKGSQIRAALERSVSLFPSPTDSFLQLSNIEAVFSKSAPPDSRVTSVTLGGAKLDDARFYMVAMPGTLARGGLGYFKVWDRSQIRNIVEGVTLGEVLKGRKPVETAPRWKVAP